MELRPYLDILRRWWWIVLTAFVVTTSVTVMLVLPQRPVYESTATFVVGPRYLDREEAVRALDTLTRGEAITATYTSIAGSDFIRSRAESRLDSEPSSDLNVGAEVLTGTNVLSISVQGHEPEPARDLAAAIAAETVAYVEDLDDAYELKPLDSPDLPSQPVGPNKALTIALGTVFAAVLGVALAMLGEYRGSTTVASWATRAGAPLKLMSGLNINDPEEFLRIFWLEMSLARRNGDSFSLGVLHLALQNGEKDELSHDLSRSHLTRIADVLQSDLREKDGLTYLGHGTLAVMLPDKPIAEAQKMLTAWERAIASIYEGSKDGDGTENGTAPKLHVSTGLCVSLKQRSPAIKKATAGPVYGTQPRPADHHESEGRPLRPKE